MTVKFVANLCKGIAIAQAVIAPTLMVVGHFTGAKTLRNVGAVWCGLIAIDTGRTTCDAIDNLEENLELKDQIEELK